VKRSIRLALLLLLALTGSLSAQNPAGRPGGPPERFKNLKVLPKNIPRDSLLSTMRGFTQALGVRCSFCHATVQGASNPDSLDFPADTKVEKRNARVMLKMVRDINAKRLPDLPGRADPPVRVSCITCHRGSQLPRTIDLVVEQVIDSAGVDVAVQRYRQLRTETMERGRYDFSEGPVNDLARRLAAQGKTADALKLLDMNAELHPASAAIDLEFGDIYRASGDREKALTHYRAALEKQPNNPQARRRVQELSGGAAPR
jgi:hypothetical protein